MRTRLPIVVMAACGAAAAQARTMEAKLQAVCALEIHALCPDRSPDETKACMLQKRAQVSAACITLIDASE